MISYRPFRNTDPPGLVEVWRSQPPLRRRAQGVSVETLERHIFSRPYFEREGLIVAEQHNRLLGFAHGGFTPSPDGATLNPHRAVVSALLTTPDAGEEVGSRLLESVETYLGSRGATSICAGGVGAMCPFYLGLYGGGELPGILQGDPQLQAFEAHGYTRTNTTNIWQRSLSGFRPIVDRNLMKIRRTCHVEAYLDPPPDHWWDACTTADVDRAAFRVEDRTDRTVRGRIVFCEMEAFSQSWGTRAVGMHRVEAAGAHDDESLLLFLLGEGMKQLQSQGVHLVEAQLQQLTNDATLVGLPHDGIRESGRELKANLLKRLGFENVDVAHCLWKTKT